MSDYNMEGVSKISGGVYDKMTIDGVGTCTGDVKAEEMHISGVFKCLGSVDVGLLESDGTAEFRSSIRAKKMMVEGVVTVKGEGTIKADELFCDGVFKCFGEVEAGLLDTDGTATFHSNIRAKKLVVDGVLTVRDKGRIEADEIICGGVITAGEVSADLINADGIINAKEIVGDKIIIKSHLNKVFRFFAKKFSNVELIEATTIELHGVVAKSVSGRDIIIGKNCGIDSIDFKNNKKQGDWKKI
ncbi:MAG: hypothetical protein WCP73_06735 [Eubacteriales bacterium]